MVSGRLAYEKLVRVFDERRKALEKAGLGEGDFLPFKFQQEVQKKLRADWEGSDEGKHWLKWLQQCRRLSDREMATVWRRQQLHDFGGAIWCNLLIALGDLDDRLVVMVNDEQDKRTLANMGPRQSTQALASAQGKRQKRADKTWPEEGIKHLCSVGKEERDKAKHLDKKIKWEEERWAAGRSKMTRQAWDDLVAQRASQWDKAENISFLARHSFKDRNGVMQCTEPIDLVGIVLRRWCLAQGVVYV